MSGLLSWGNENAKKPSRGRPWAAWGRKTDTGSAGRPSRQPRPRPRGPLAENTRRVRAATKPNRAAALTLKRVRLADLKPHASNPRTHPEPGSAAWVALKRSLEADYFEPLVINSGRTVASLRNVIVSGHLRVKVLTQEGYTHADAVIVDYTEQRHVEVMLRANNQSGEWDERELAALLKDIPSPDLELTGFDAEEINRLIGEIVVSAVGAETQSRLDQKTPVECPSCHQKFTP